MEGDLTVPTDASGLVLFAHGSGSSRFSTRNRFVAGVLQQAGIATLLFDLLTAEEESIDAFSRHLRFDIPMLASRLAAAARWIVSQEVAAGKRIGFFGASTGAAAALVAAAELGGLVSAVVSRGGRPDLASDSLTRVTAPVLLIVGALDDVVIGLNKKAFDLLTCEKELRIVPGAGHLFEEPGKLEAVAEMAAEWFARHFQTVASQEIEMRDRKMVNERTKGEIIDDTSTF